MQGHTADIVSSAIQYIENNLNSSLKLDTVAAAVHYSKFHLHRIFTKTTGLTVHDYIKRRQLTEAAKDLVFSDKPIIDIALISGYESQQAFTDVFRQMYKTTPADFRAGKDFYPLQLEIRLKKISGAINFTRDDIRFAEPADVDDWMGLVDLAVDGYPHLRKGEYAAKLRQYIAEEKALILRDDDRTAIGAMCFSPDKGSIDFFAVHPQYRYGGVTELFLSKLTGELLCEKEISLTTYRAGDKADTGYREELFRLGFAERELLMEYGYPTQRFVLLPKDKEGADYDRNIRKSIGEGV